MRKIKILDKEFAISIPSSVIKNAVDRVAMEINNNYTNEDVLFVSILNGSFMFTADLLKRIRLPSKLSFVKFSSYEGSESSGNVQELIGLNEDVKGKHVVIIEDIIETGNTIEIIQKKLKAMKPASVAIATLLFKPQAYHKNLKIDFVGMEISTEFIVGYGLDFSGYGRNYEDIYKIIE